MSIGSKIMLWASLIGIASLSFLCGCGVALSTPSDNPSSSSSQLTSPPPSITSITPTAVYAGATQTLVITGTGFATGSAVLVASDENNGKALSVSDTHFNSSNAITATLTIPSATAGHLMVRVRGPQPSSPASQPKSVPIKSPIVQVAPNLAVFPVSDYRASGSSLSYTCSGSAGAEILTCDQSELDFVAGEGVRIVGGGAPVGVPSIIQQPSIMKKGADTFGSHMYCYIVDAVDPLGGITLSSPSTCIANEPSLSYLGTYNTLSGTYPIPQATFLWYVSEDGGDFQLLGVNDPMDVGQRPGSRGGWPDRVPAGNPNISKSEDFFTSVAKVVGNQVFLSEPLKTSVVDTLVDHDDTAAIQNAINAAVTVGGGVIQFGNGTFNVRRPSFQYVENHSAAYMKYTTDFSLDPNWGRFWYLYVPNGATGNIAFEGNGASSVIQTPPDSGEIGVVMGIGNYGRPAYSPYTSIRMEEVGKGATTITLTSDPAADDLRVGDDIWLYSGAFDYSPGYKCVDNNGTAGGGCHYSELNSIAGINGRTITLKYPTSKRYYDDGINSFGLVKLPVTPHNIAIENLTFNTYDPITYTGMIYGLLINHVIINGVVNHGPFGGGYKRDVLIENSSWSFGTGDVSWGATDEYDQFINLAFVNNVITGYAAPGAEGPSTQAKIYLTEGSSQVVFNGNTLNHVSIGFQNTTDDVISNNHIVDGDIALSSAYDPFNHPLMWNRLNDTSFLSFGSQNSVDIEHNSIYIDSSFNPPFLINVGHFASAKIDNNVITYHGNRVLAAIISNGGEIENNNVTIGPETTASWGVAIIPDQGPGVPAARFNVQNNTVNGDSISAGVYVVNAGFLDTAPVCIQGNTVGVTRGAAESIANGAVSDLKCN